MFAALNILFCFLLPSMFALGACAISLSALRRHLTIRQLLFTAFVLIASISAVAGAYQAMMVGQTSLLPIALIGFTFIFSIGQFATAALLGGLGRLRAKMS